MQRAFRHALILVGFGGVIIGRPASSVAQVDTTRAISPDSTGLVGSDSTRLVISDSSGASVADSTSGFRVTSAPYQAPDSLVAIPHPFSSSPAYLVGEVIDSLAPAQQYPLDLTRILGEAPGSFSYDLGNLGWPHQWSFLAAPPSLSELQLDGITLRDPTTHRALFDALPIDLLTPVRQSAIAHGSANTATASVRGMDERRPYTELRYENGAFGLQSISGTHVQQRQWHILGAPTVTQFLARLGFHEWTGGYPNSESNLTQAFGRVGFTSRRWRLRFTDSYSLRTRGAHGGVIPNSSGFDSVYDRLGASVQDPSANQRFRRNQFDVSVEHTWTTDLKPLTIRMSFVNSLYRYVNQDTVETKSSEFHLRMEQAVPEIVTGHEMVARMSFASAGLSSDGLIEGGGGGTKTRFVVSIDDRFEIAGLSAQAMVGLHNDLDWVFPAAGLSLSHRSGALSITAEANLNGRAPSPLETSGGLGVAAPQNELTRSATRAAELSIGLVGRVLGLELTGFLTGIQDPVELIEISDAAFAVAQSAGSVTWTGISGKLSWRPAATSGFYGWFSPTISSASSSINDPVTSGLVTSLPDFFGTARLGFRAQLFEGDLDADLFVSGRFWSQYSGRTYNSVHALLVLPSSGARPVEASGTMDVRFEADIREAKIFISVDNILAQMVYPGALIVPVYPLPSQAFRLGIYWPIWG